MTSEHAIARVVIVPRWAGTGAHDWYPWVRARLAEDPGPALTVEVVELPDPSAPVIERCVEALTSALGGSADGLRGAMLVGHSVGCQALLRYLATLPDGEGPAALVCVAGWWKVDKPWPSIRPWIETPLELERVRALVDGRVHVLLSDNDPFTTDWRANQRAWEERVGGRVEVVEGGGHFNGDVDVEVGVLGFLRGVLGGVR